MPPIEPNHETSKALLSLVFSVGVTLGSGIAYGLSQLNSSKLEIRQEVTCPQQELLTRADYLSLESGMSITDVQSILGKGTEVSRSTTTTTFIWENCDDSSIKVIFENSTLKSKHQSGL